MASSTVGDFIIHRLLSSCSSSAANWYARDLKIRNGMLASLSGGLATLGPGVPYGIAAKFAFPACVAIAMVDDGAMQMNGSNELNTVRDHWQSWDDPRLIILVLNNRDPNQVTWEQCAQAGDLKYDAAQHVVDFPYARYAEMLGLKAVRVDKSEQIGPARDTALEADRPCLIKAITDPEVPPLPPHITLAPTVNIGRSLRAGDVSRRITTCKSTIQNRSVNAKAAVAKWRLGIPIAANIVGRRRNTRMIPRKHRMAVAAAGIPNAAGNVTASRQTM